MPLYSRLEPPGITQRKTPQTLKQKRRELGPVVSSKLLTSEKNQLLSCLHYSNMGVADTQPIPSPHQHTLEWLYSFLINLWLGCLGCYCWIPFLSKRVIFCSMFSSKRFYHSVGSAPTQQLLHCSHGPVLPANPPEGQSHLAMCQKQEGLITWGHTHNPHMGHNRLSWPGTLHPRTPTT